jgi:hypothetical protein
MALSGVAVAFSEGVDVTCADAVALKAKTPASVTNAVRQPITLLIPRLLCSRTELTTSLASESNPKTPLGADLHQTSGGTRYCQIRGSKADQSGSIQREGVIEFA